MAPVAPQKTLDPTQVRAVLTTKWQGSAYKAQTIRTVESYEIETAIDTDADSWSLDLGAIKGDLNDTLMRDNEIRVQIFGAGKDVTYLMTGIADEVTFSEAGTLVVSGRDLSSLATDSIHFPETFRGKNAAEIIKSEALTLGFEKFSLAPVPGGPKTQYTDGSETYWEFWYRLIRKEKQYLWVEPDGTLVSSTLTNPPSKYAFSSVSVAKSGEIPVIEFSFRKSTQPRIGKVGVLWGQQAEGESQSVVFVTDDTIKEWQKQPDKLIQDKNAKNTKAAQKIGDEEIYESKVGAIELTLTIPDTGVLVERNTMASVRIPEQKITGKFFVVGCTIKGDAGGFVQEVRLREEGFAVSQRTPDDPKWDTNFEQKGAETPATSHAGDCTMSGPLVIDDGIALSKAISKWMRKYNASSPLLPMVDKIVDLTGFHNMSALYLPAIALIESTLGQNNCGAYNYYGWNCGPGKRYDAGSSMVDAITNYVTYFGTDYVAAGYLTPEQVANRYCPGCHLPDGTTYAELLNKYINELIDAAGSSIRCGTGGPATTGPEGIAGASIRDKIVKWAMKGYQDGKPTYGQYSGSYKRTPGDWPVSDCSDYVGLVYCWATDADQKYDPNQNAWNDGYTGSLIQHGQTVDGKDVLRGDIAIWIPDNGDPGRSHTAIFVEDGPVTSSTKMVSHGGGSSGTEPPNYTTFGDQDNYQVNNHGAHATFKNYIGPA